MFNLYEKYLETVDEYLKKCFEEQNPFIKCKRGCAACCEIGEYPLSRLEMEYLMQGYTTLQVSSAKHIQKNIKDLLGQKETSRKPFLHRCPFLSDENQCFLYERRPIVCRTHGLASFETINGQKTIKFPQCSENGLNYSEIFNGKEVFAEDFQKHGVESPIKHSLRLDFFEKEILKGFAGLEFGEIRPLLEWFKEN